MHQVTYQAAHQASIAFLGREAQEYQAIEGYRAGTLSHYQARELLGMSYFQFEVFLRDRHIHESAEAMGDCPAGRAN